MNLYLIKATGEPRLAVGENEAQDVYESYRTVTDDVDVFTVSSVDNVTREFE